MAVKGKWLPDFMDSIRMRRGLGLIEMKNTEAWFRKNWVDGAPDHYYIQLQHQLLVLGLDWGVLVAKVGAGDMIAHIYDADRKLHEEIKTDAAEFWKEVEDGRREFDEYA